MRDIQNILKTNNGNHFTDDIFGNIIKFLVTLQ